MSIYKQHKTGVVIINYHIKSQQTSNKTLNYLSLTHISFRSLASFDTGSHVRFKSHVTKQTKWPLKTGMLKPRDLKTVAAGRVRQVAA